LGGDRGGEHMPFKGALKNECVTTSPGGQIGVGGGW